MFVSFCFFFFEEKKKPLELLQFLLWSHLHMFIFCPAPLFIPWHVSPKKTIVALGCLTDGHSFSITQLGGTGCFVLPVRLRGCHNYMLQVRSFTGQTNQKVVFSVTQRRQCAWQWWMMCSQAALAIHASCEISRNGEKVRRTQGVFVWTVYSSLHALFLTETVPWCCVAIKVSGGQLGLELRWFPHWTRGTVSGPCY